MTSFSDELSYLRENRIAQYTYSTGARFTARAKTLVGSKVVSGGLGLDLSAWQLQADPQAAQAAGLEFAFIRALYGLTEDTKFPQHYPAFLNVLPRAAYLYYRDHLDPVAQAQKLHSTCLANGDAGELLPVVDVESINNPLLTAAKIRACVEKVEDAFNRTPLIYTGYYVWRDAVKGDKTWAINYPLWIAGYSLTGWTPDLPEKVLNYPPMIPAPWQMWPADEDAPLEGLAAVWQFTASAPAAQFGVSGNHLDLNHCSPAFAKYLNGGSNPPPPEAEVKQARCLVDKLNVRNKPAKTIDVGDILKDEIVFYYPADTVTLPGQEWLHVRKADHTVGWAARKHPDFVGLSLELL